MAADSGIRQGEVVRWGPRASVTLSGSSQEEWSYHDFVRVLLEIDSRSAWLKVRVIGAAEARYGEETLKRLAEDTGMAYQTVLSYRALDKAYPAAEFSALNIPVRVAQAFIAQDDRAELVSREDPWTGEEARAFVAEREEERQALPPGKRGRGRPRGGKADPHADLKASLTGKGSVPAGDDTNAQNRREDCKPGPVPQPPGPVQGSVTGTAESASATTETAPAAAERKPHACRVFACPECGKPDTAFSEQAGKLMDERDALRTRVAGLEQENRELRAELSDALSAPRPEGPGNVLQPGWQAPDYARGGGQVPLDADGNVIPDYDDDLSWLDDQAPDEGSQVPARGKRR